MSNREFWAQNRNTWTISGIAIPWNSHVFWLLAQNPRLLWERSVRTPGNHYEAWNFRLWRQFAKVRITRAPGRIEVPNLECPKLGDHRRTPSLQTAWNYFLDAQNDPTSPKSYGWIHQIQ